MPVGATLVLYTDGLVESRRRTAADGVALLKVALGRSRPDIELMLEDILLDLAPSHDDDIAMLAIEMLPQPSASLKRWVYRLIDRATVNVIRSEFDAILASCAAPGSDTFDSRLILDELLANVVRHAPGAFRLELDWSAAAPTLHLHDNGPGFAVGEEFPGPQDLLSVSGRGLFLIGALGGSLKIVRRPSGGLSTSVTLPAYRTPVAGSAAALAPAG
jgi:anti-sigma regulatory factor (Ser/Thr protein kinase)